MVDRSEIYPGAVVTVRAKVTHVGDNGVTVEALALDEADVNHMRDIGVHFRDILTVEPRPLAVGDRVRHRDSVGKIALIHAGEASLIWEVCHPLGRAGKLSVPFDLADLSPSPAPAPAEERET